GYLLDTNVVLHATRENSPISTAVEAQFQLRNSPFRPTICEVTVAELWAFAQSWGEKRKELLKRTINGSVAESVGQNGTPGVTDGNGHGSLLCHNGTPAGPDDEFFALARDLQRHPGRTASGHHMFRRIPVHFRL